MATVGPEDMPANRSGARKWMVPGIVIMVGDFRAR